VVTKGREGNAGKGARKSKDSAGEEEFLSQLGIPTMVSSFYTRGKRMVIIIHSCCSWTREELKVEAFLEIGCLNPEGCPKALEGTWNWGKATIRASGRWIRSITQLDILDLVSLRAFTQQGWIRRCRGTAFKNTVMAPFHSAE
jgi:hypothetical protein